MQASYEPRKELRGRVSLMGEMTIDDLCPFDVRLLDQTVRVGGIVGIATKARVCAYRLSLPLPELSLPT